MWVLHLSLLRLCLNSRFPTQASDHDGVVILINFAIIFSLFGLIGTICEQYYFVLTTLLFDVTLILRVTGAKDKACLGTDTPTMLCLYLLLNVLLIMLSLCFTTILFCKQHQSSRKWIDFNQKPPDYSKVVRNIEKYPRPYDSERTNINAEHLPSYSSLDLPMILWKNKNWFWFLFVHRRTIRVEARIAWNIRAKQYWLLS